MATKYTVDYFIDKFSNIPEENFITGSLQMDNKCCALGYCGMKNYDKIPREAIALIDIITPKAAQQENKVGISYFVTDVNDGIGSKRELGSTPKERILNKLKEIKSQIK